MYCEHWDGATNLDMPYDEIAQTMGITPKAARTRGRASDSPSAAHFPLSEAVT